MAYQTLGDLDKIISTLNTLSNQAQQRESKRYSRDASIYDEFNSDLETTYSNDRLNILESRVNDYINQNSGNFNDLSSENFALLKDKIEFQREDNKAYQSGYQKLIDYGDSNYELVGNFKKIQDLTQDENGMVEYDGKKVNKNDLLIKQKADMQDHVKGFLDVQQNFVTEFGGEKGRLTNISQRDRLARILNFDEIFRFGVDSISDEFLDPQEYEAYKNALDYKDSSYIDEFKTIRNQQQSNIRNFHEKTALKSFETVNENLKSISAYDDFIKLFAKTKDKNISGEDRRKAEKILDSFKIKPFPISSSTGTDVKTYGDLLTMDGSSLDLQSPLSVSITQLQSENLDIANKLNKMNKTYTQTAGIGGLDQLGFEFNDETLQNQAFGTPITKQPTPTPTPTPTPPPPAQQSLSQELGVKSVNVSSDASNVMPWASKKIKSLGNNLNELRGQIDNFTYGPKVQETGYEGDFVGAKILSDFLGKDTNKEIITYKDFGDIERMVQDSQSELNELWNTITKMKKLGYKNNSPEIEKQELAINKIFKKYKSKYIWFPRRGNPSKILATKPNQFSVLEYYNVGTGRLNRLRKKHSDMSKDYNEKLEATSIKK